jgi:hypothetical protein
MLEFNKIGGPWDTTAIVDDGKQIGTIRKVGRSWQVTLRNGLTWQSQLLKTQTNSANFKTRDAAILFTERVIGDS